MRLHDQGYTQSDMEEFDKIATKKELRRFFYRTGVIQRPIQGRTTLPGGGSDTVKTEYHTVF